MDRITLDKKSFGLSGKIDNLHSSEKIEVCLDEKFRFVDPRAKYCKVSFQGAAENAGGYLVINGGIKLPINSTTCMEIVTPVEFEVKLVVSAESAIDFDEIVFEERRYREDLVSACGDEQEVLIVVPDYPSYVNLYLCAFAHSRNREYVKNGLKIQVAAISSLNWIEYSYEFESIPVYKGGYAGLQKLIQDKNYKVIMTHFVDDNLFSVYDKYVGDDKEMIFICHGPETVYRYLENKVRPYFTQPIVNSPQEEHFKKVDQYIAKYSQKDNVEWVFVSEWLKNYSEEQQHLQFKHCRVINNIMNEKLFPYVEKTAEQRKKILMIRKFDNVSQHSIDQCVLAILELSKKPFFKELDFEIYGDGNYYDELVEPIRKFDNIHFHRTFIPNNQIKDIHKEMGILLIPSRHDAHAVSMGEAASSGLVVVGSSVTSNPYFMQQERFHTLADPEDPVELAGIIERLYYNPEEFLEISRELSKFTRENFCMKHTVYKEIEMIQEKIRKEEAKEAAGAKPIKWKSLCVILSVHEYNQDSMLNRMNQFLEEEFHKEVQVVVLNFSNNKETVKCLKEKEAMYPKSLFVFDSVVKGYAESLNEALQCVEASYVMFGNNTDWADYREAKEYLNKIRFEESDVILSDYQICELDQAVKNIHFGAIPREKVLNMNEIDFGRSGDDFLKVDLFAYKTDLVKKYANICPGKEYYDVALLAFRALIKADTLVYHDLEVYRFDELLETSARKKYLVETQNQHKIRILYLLDSYAKNKEKINPSKRKMIEDLLMEKIYRQYMIYCFFDKNHKRAYTEGKKFDATLKSKNEELYQKAGEVEYIRYHRKTKFALVRYDGKKGLKMLEKAVGLKRKIIK